MHRKWFSWRKVLLFMIGAVFGLEYAGDLNQVCAAE